MTIPAAKSQTNASRVLRRWDSPGNPSLLFFHGFMGSCDDWAPVCEQLTQSYTCISLSLPAAEQADRQQRDFEASLGIDAMAVEISATIRSLELGQFVAVGYSMGGRVLLAALCSGLISPRAAIFVSASPGLELESERMARVELDESLADRLEREGLKAFLEQWYGASVFASLAANPELRAALVAKRLRSNDGLWLAKQLREASPGRSRSHWQSLSELQIPQFWLAGESDSRYCDYVRRVRQQVPSAETVVLSSCGHAIVEEQPQVLARHIEHFLSQNVFTLAD